MWNSAVTVDASHNFVGTADPEAANPPTPVTGSPVRATTVNVSHNWFGSLDYANNLILPILKLSRLVLDFTANCWGHIPFWNIKHVCQTEGFACALYPQRLCPKIPLMAPNPPQTVNVIAGAASATMSWLPPKQTFPPLLNYTITACVTTGVVAGVVFTSNVSRAGASDWYVPSASET